MIARRTCTEHGYRTTWSGDLSPDLPTQRLLRIDAPLGDEISEPTRPPLHVLRAVLEGLKRL